MGERLGLRAPLGVLAINLLGAFLLGLLVGAHPSDVAVIALGTGFLGSFTTFSTWMLETDALAAAIAGAAAMMVAAAATAAAMRIRFDMRVPFDCVRLGDDTLHARTMGGAMTPVRVRSVPQER